MQHAPSSAPTSAWSGAARHPILPVAVVLVGTLVALLLIGQRPIELRVPIGAPGDAAHVSGMYAPERGELGPAFRWTTPLAQLRAPGTAFFASGLLLRMHGDLEATTPRPLTIRRGERPIEVLSLAPGWRDYHLLAPGAGWDAWDDPPVLLAVAALPRAADDGRDKGFPLAYFGLLPLERARIPWPLLPAVTLLAVAAAGLWRIDRALGWPGARRGWRVAAAVSLPAALLLVWAARDPQRLVSTLPALPWTLGLLALVWLLAARPAQQPGTRTRLLAAASVALMLLGLLLLGRPQLLPLGGALAAVGLLLFPALPARPAEQEAWPTVRASIVALSLIVALALGLRVFRIAELPYGLWRDEGQHALEALRMLEQPSYRPAYVEAVDLPGLGLLPFSWALEVWGIRPWSLRTVTALAGALTVLPLYCLVALLTRSRATALLAALLLASAHWSVALSRFSFPTVFDPLLQLTALCLLLYALPGERALLRRCVALLASGACLGLAAQTYHTGRMGPLVAAAFVLSYWAGNTVRRRDWLLVPGLLGIGFVLAAFPLLEYALVNPARFSSRLGSVSLLGVVDDWHGPLGRLDRSIGAHVMMWWARGDLNGRHVAPGRPMLDPLSGLGLLIGSALLMRGLADWRKRCLLLGLVLGLVPSALAVEYPHAMRSIDALGFGCAIAALGLVEAGRALSEPRIGRRAIQSLALSAAGVVVGVNAWIYFVSMPPDRAVWTAVYPYHTQVGGYLRHLAGQRSPDALSDMYVPSNLAGNAVYEYLSYGLAPRTYQPETPANAAPGSQFIVLGTLSQPDVERILALQRLDPASAIDGPLLPDGSRPAFTVYRVGR